MIKTNRYSCKIKIIKANICLETNKQSISSQNKYYTTHFEMVKGNRIMTWTLCHSLYCTVKDLFMCVTNLLVQDDVQLDVTV